MGSSTPRTGIKSRPMWDRLTARKSQYLKKNSSARLKITDEATAALAPRMLPFRLLRVTSMPRV